MKVEATALPGVLLIEPRVFGDSRGYFFESWNRQRYREQGVEIDFVQDNLSYSERGVLRGLHCQQPYGQGKLVQVLEGEVFDVAVDIRRGSPTFGKSVSVYLSAENRRQLYIPPGFAHGFGVTSPHALFSYKCTDAYHPECEFTVLWNDPALALEWPIANPSLSDKDVKGLRLQDIPPDRLPVYVAP
ncbi:dTDP-4-dehydrorhamnose 3,5-epimerase [Methylotetracoccus oryzae]|uniref:dTDP-4-dehydrorhamnose 3,5-epimerase n=1 Tax=Methylotetracoccus oryzae TaxID=1919059 RepID=UPI00111B364E|nr:dTDP-4-dehydrorhamnose 3,5-epimerase [Methylotetracoccus oryzae]